MKKPWLFRVYRGLCYYPVMTPSLTPRNFLGGQDDYGRTPLQWACYKGNRRRADKQKQGQATGVLATPDKQ